MTTDLPARTLHFPTDRSVGALYLTPDGVTTAGARELGEARGDIPVPAGAYLTLTENESRILDLTGLTRLNPDDLQCIGAAYLGITDDDLRFVRHLTGLRYLGLTETYVTDAGLAHLSSLTGLRGLHIETMPITDAGIAHLRPLIGLESLEITQTKITGASLAHIGHLTNLRYLSLSVEDENETADRESTIVLAADEMAHLRHLRHLERLALFPDITDAGVVFLSELTHLRDLWIFGRDITDAGLEHLKRLTDLRWLFLQKTSITDDGLRHLSSMPGLEMLWLNHTPITDAGLDILAGYRGLRELNLADTSVTDAGVVRLRAALPECRIYQTDKEFYNAPRDRPRPSE